MAITWIAMALLGNPGNGHPGTPNLYDTSKRLRAV